MELSTNSLVYKWAYLPERLGDSHYHLYSPTSLCPVFWRCVLLVPIFCLAGLVVGPIFLIASGVQWVGSRMSRRTPRLEFMDVGVEYIKAIKSRVCPIIYWKDDNANNQ